MPDNDQQQSTATSTSSTNATSQDNVTTPPAGGQPEKPPWGDNFDPQRAFDTITKLRDENKDIKSLASTLKKQGLSVDQALEAVAEVSKIRAEKQTDVERLQAEAQAAAEKISVSEGLATSFRDRAVAAEVKAAAGQFNDPADAVALVGGLDQFVKDGEIDTDAITKAVADLAEKRPYLLAGGGQQPRMRPNLAQGQSGAPNLTPSQAAREAEKTGDRTRSSQLKADQLLQLRQQQ